MKAFIIYTPHEKSIEYAQAAMDSFENFKGWEPELFEGVTIETLDAYEEKFPLKTKELSRAADYYKYDLQKYKIKKCCSLNHYRLFKRCVELNEPIAVIEHDSHCISNWDNPTFDGVLVLNAVSAIKQDTLRPVWDKNKDPIKSGIQNINFNGLNYRHDPTLKHAHIMPGTAAYAITPNGAQKMIDAYENSGWEQSDFMINTGRVRIQTIVPELFTFKLPNLSMSHGNIPQ